MSRPSQSRCGRRLRRAERWRARRGVAAPAGLPWAAALALVAIALTGADASVAATRGARGPANPPPAAAPASAAGECGPIAPDDAARGARAAEPGVLPSGAESGGAGPGSIVPLPAAAGPAEATPAPGEALLALPKGADGRVPDEFELAPGATVAASFFSPVLCATVVRVVGPPDRAPEALVVQAPEGALAVANDVYVGAQAELRPLAPEQDGDPYRPLQWGLARAGAERAWPVADGAGATVAVLDSAPDAAHRDLAGVRVESVPGAPTARPGTHGSLMAGVVRAVAGNGFGIAGLAPGAALVGVPVCRPHAEGAADECRLFELLRGIDVAWAERAQVLNVSLVGPPNALLRRAVERMDELGAVVVAAAGNEGLAEPRYPAAYPSVVGVGAVDRAGAPYARGNRGAWVELLGPGVEILSTVPGGGFAFGDGTSLAAAHVTGVLALAISASGDPRAARAALFEAAQARLEAPGREPAPLPAACDVLALLRKPCR